MYWHECEPITLMETQQVVLCHGGLCNSIDTSNMIIPMIGENRQLGTYEPAEFVK